MFGCGVLQPFFTNGNCFLKSGKTYTFNKDHEPQFTDLILNNPEGLSFTQALKFYTFTPGFASAYIDWKREQQSLPANDIAMCEVWNPNTNNLEQNPGRI